MKQLYDELQALFSLSDFSLRRDTQAQLTVPADRAVSLITHLKEQRGYSHLALMTCVDWLEQGLFQLTYILHNYADASDLILKVLLPREQPVMEGIHHLWEHARVYQRELHEMFGLSFPGSPGLEEPMILEGWQGPPVMRRDFDTRKYSEEHYSHRPREEHKPEEHMHHQLYPED